jgi:hypothetical protein
MIEVLFTIDYEIYGNGTGSLNELVYEPARRLVDLFQQHESRFVVFAEVAEFEKIEAYGTDPAIDLVNKQLREFYRDGFEVGLHLHPQWANASYQHGQWSLDLSEYNLCKLPRKRIGEIVDGSMAYLRHVVGDPHFTPLSFRAGNWLFQPTKTAASVLWEKGIKIDSSAFKGGLQHNQSLDYRPALRNGYYWPFSSDVNDADPAGQWIEVPIHTDMVPFWRMTTSKRMKFPNRFGATDTSARKKLSRTRDFLRLRYPRKFDFCRMTLDEMTSMLEKVIAEDRKDPDQYRPLVSIGHTKDLTDFATVDSILSFFRMNKIKVSTFPDIYPTLKSTIEPPAMVSH